MMLFKYFTRRRRQSFGSTFSSCEVAKASGKAARLSTEIENGSRRWSARIIFLKKRFAALISRLAESINSMVFPSLSTARYRYLHVFPTQDVRLVNAVRGAAHLETRTDSLIDFGSVSLDTAPHRRMMHLKTTLPHHLFDVTVRKLKATIPPDAQKDDRRLEVAPLKG